ncbi:MAG TPA: hypothetical protein VM939_01365 [Gemmatimonadaceae bacterium]|nr:hypothetical protein [Gemmatimonadaceae bacterium]
MNASKVAIACFTLLAAEPVDAQLFHVSLRGGAGVPIGPFAERVSSSSEEALVARAKTGFGYGAEAGLGLGIFGLYAGFDQIEFGCETTACASEGKFELAGASGGVRIALPFYSAVHPWIKGGVTFNKLRGEYRQSGVENLTTDRAPGFELGAGIDIPIFGIISLAPQVRYVGQDLKYKVPGVTSPTTTEKGVEYYTFDLGLSLRSFF